jgi:hypothetical protein
MALMGESVPMTKSTALSSSNFCVSVMVMKLWNNGGLSSCGLQQLMGVRVPMTKPTAVSSSSCACSQ